MPGMATQRAPRQAPRQDAPNPQNGAKAQQKTGFRNRLYDLPRAAGIVGMAVLLGISLFMGNFRALAGATPTAFIRQGDVASILEDRMDAAVNVLTLAGRADVDPALLDSARSAITDLQEAESAREISRADQRLTSAVSALVAEASDALEGEDQTMLTRAADDFAEQGSFLRQEARTYNEQAEKAEELYESLPTKFVLPEPDVYEGI